jgi:MEDS: MEthanogen/methylotroph, DcmR Sensory domain
VTAETGTPETVTGSRMEPTAMGLPGVAFTPGLHICAFYRGAAQRDELLLPYLREGLANGDKCICVTDDPAAGQSVLALAGEFGIDPATPPTPLEPLDSGSTYLSGGSFAIEKMIGFWDREMSTAVAKDGFGFVRAAGEMTWALRGQPGSQLLMAYEAQLNVFLHRYPQVLLCLYDLEQFANGGIVMEILRTHPTVLMSGRMIDNPWYVEPEEYLGRHTPAGA